MRPHTVTTVMLFGTAVKRAKGKLVISSSVEVSQHAHMVHITAGYVHYTPLMTRDSEMHKYTFPTFKHTTLSCSIHYTHTHTQKNTHDPGNFNV